MTAPPFLISATLLFWGWQTKLMLLSVILCISYESPRIVRSRWDLSFDDFNRISDLCTLILAGIVMVVLVTNADRFFQIVLTWLPLSVFPLVLAQKYSVAGRVDIRSIMILARKKKTRSGSHVPHIDIAYPFMAFCLFSAGAGDTKSPYYYSGLVLLVCTALFSVRAKRYSVYVWAGILFTAAVSGYAGHVGLSRLQTIVVDYAIGLMAGGQADPHKQVTALGDIGQLKMSGDIAFRINKDNPGPVLLQEASYNTMRGTSWYATNSRFKMLGEGSGLSGWNSVDAREVGESVTVYQTTSKGAGLMKLPAGTIRIEGVRGGKVKKNTLNAFKLIGIHGFTSYTAYHIPGSIFTREPDKTDIIIPEHEKKTIAGVVGQLNLKLLPRKVVLEKLDEYFTENYTYSLELKGKGGFATPLENFIKNTRQGHCEMFASATTLILRAVGIPARYTTGYLVHEHGLGEGNYIVRERDAHAWVQVFIDGRWQSFDTTPSTWINADRAYGRTSTLGDLLSNMTFAVLKWKNGLTGIELVLLALVMLIPLMAILWIRLKAGKKIRRTIVGGHIKETKPVVVEFKATDLNQAEEVLVKLGYQRHCWETYKAWFDRLLRAGVLELSENEKEKLLSIHYRERFDRKGPGKIETDWLTEKVSQLIKQLI